MFGKTKFLGRSRARSRLGNTGGLRGYCWIGGVSWPRLPNGVCQRDGCAAIDFALNPRRAAVKIDNRFHECQTQARAVGARVQGA